MNTDDLALYGHFYGFMLFALWQIEPKRQKVENENSLVGIWKYIFQTITIFQYNIFQVV